MLALDPSKGSLGQTNGFPGLLRVAKFSDSTTILYQPTPTLANSNINQSEICVVNEILFTSISKFK